MDQYREVEGRRETTGSNWVVCCCWMVEWIMWLGHGVGSGSWIGAIGQHQMMLLSSVVGSSEVMLLGVLR